MSGGVRQAMVFAAGEGKRLRPLTQVLPKPAVPILDRPLVAWPLEQAAAAGAERVVVNTWRLSERMEAALARVRPAGVELVVSRETELMGTAGGLALARERGLLAAGEPVVVVNGDGILRLDLEAVLERHRTGSDLLTLALLPHLGPDRWARLQLDSEGRVVAIRPPGEPAPGEVPLLYPGVAVLSWAAVERLPVRECGLGEMLLVPALEEGRLGGVVVSGHWREVGRPEDYLEAVAARLGDRSFTAADARVDASAVLERAMVGEGCTVGPGAVLRSSIVADGCTVGPRARLERTIVLGAVEVPGDAVLTDAVLVP